MIIILIYWESMGFWPISCVAGLPWLHARAPGVGAVTPKTSVKAGALVGDVGIGRTGSRGLPS
jgi:hypothetical protein